MEEKDNLDEEILEDKKGSISINGETNKGHRNEEIIDKRKEKTLDFLKKSWAYLILAIIIWIGVRVRSLNLSKLRDVTTNSWTLGPDLDPFLFLRWAKEIVANGSLAAIDYMRNVPLGFNTAGESVLLPHMIVWLHKFLAFFGWSDDITYSAIVFPVVAFALTAIGFFLFARKIFYKEKDNVKNTIALLATGLFVLIPSLLPRTIAGIPEKESIAFFFMFLAFYFFMEAFTAKKDVNGYIFGALAGLSTGIMALIWGGAIFVFMAIPAAVLFDYILGKVKWKESIIYLLWLVFAFVLMIPFSTRYTPWIIITSFTTGTAIGVLALIIIGLIIMRVKQVDKIRIKLGNLPPELFSVIVAGLVSAIIILAIFGPSFITSRLNSINHFLVEPSQSRFSFTVAENKQPYFTPDWASSFGPIWNDIPVYFLLFFIGAIFLFYHLISSLKRKEKIILMVTYTLFLTAIIFSRYSANSNLNGLSGLSLFVYFGGTLVFLLSFIYIYIKEYKSGEFELFKKFSFTYIAYFIILTLGIIGARGAIRLIMVLGAITPVVIGFIVVKFSEKTFIEKEDTKKFVVGGIALLLIILYLFTFYVNYKEDVIVGSNYAPGAYQWQWQQSMSWVRDSTPEDAVFGHWWDYGYWLQSIGERATVLDGGNAIIYWNHLMGRYALTGNNEREALEFLYAHNTTHFLIDSTDIGKYAAFSSIGSDATYDRRSWIPTFLRDNNQIKETKNSTITVYTGGSSLDGDLIYEDNGTRIFLPGGNAGIGAVLIEKEASGNLKKQPEGIFVYQDKQYNLPLRYAFSNGKFLDFGSGAEAGVFIFPRVTETSIEPDGALLYLSDRTVKSQLARLYLYKENDPNFKLVYSEDDYVVEQVKKQNPKIGDIIFFNGIRGPIRIWEIEYPKDIKFKQEYLNKEYPKELYYA